MCGRFSFVFEEDKFEEYFGLQVDVRLPRNYNVAPSQDIVVIRNEADNKKKMDFLKWGLVPFWADDPSIGHKMINARIESVGDKPSYKQAYKNKRCLIPASGYYEWKKEKEGKQPFYIKRYDSNPLAFAGLWEKWTDDQTGEELQTCTIITAPADELNARIHSRMPLILNPANYDSWLDRYLNDYEKIDALLEPLSSELLTSYPVSKAVNSPKNNTPELLLPQRN
jgi:putative SOS response-associated peptidase YedK